MAFFCTLSRNRLNLLYKSIIKSKLTVTSTRNIMFTKSRLDKVVQELQRNPYYDKYAEKIAKMQKTSPEEFLQRVEEKERKIKEEKERRAKERKFYDSAAKPNLEPGCQSQQVDLNSIMKLEMVIDKTPDEIKDIWCEYHKEKDCIVGVISKELFEKMLERGKQYNTFLLPLPRENGYEFIVCQFQGTQIHMTPLIWYQAHKENAPECLTMTHFTELKDTKGIILMKGEFDIKSLNVQEAQCLANELQLYYTCDNNKRLELLKTFNEKPDEFKHMDLISQMETISLDSHKMTTEKSK